MSIVDIPFDLETSNDGPGGSPEAHYPENDILWCGWLDPSGDIKTEKGGASELMKLVEGIIKDGEQPRLVAHNAKFDIKYLMRDYPEFNWPSVDVYCTMYGEYRQSGHAHKTMSLEDACAIRNIKFTKTLDLSKVLASGLKMRDIPDSDLEPYLYEDVNALWRLFFAQITHSDYKEVLHNHIFPLAEIELNGLPLDVGKAKKEMIRSSKAVMNAESYLWDVFQMNMYWDDSKTVLDRSKLKFTSPRMMSHLLTGEPQKLTNHKTRTLKFKPGLTKLLSDGVIKKVWGNTQPSNLGYPMGADKLKLIIDLVPSNSAAHHFAKAALDFREEQKLSSTYYGPFLEQAKWQTTIHPKMNYAVTGTGRLSSSAPNGQNMPPTARELFISTNGKMVEIDFKQLEVVALAYLSGDPQLIADIQNGEDIHFNTGKSVMGWKVPADMNDKDRKLVKNVNFGLIYGGGASGLAAQTGQPKKLIAQLIKAFYARYPGVEQWQEDFYKQVVGNMKPGGFDNNEQWYYSLVYMPNVNRKFMFKENPAPAWIKRKTGRGFCFKPTETKNYPVQGFAGGDIVMEALYQLWVRLWHCPNTKIRMSVHDSIVIDTDINKSDLHDTMTVVCNEIVQRYVMPFKLEFDLELDNYWK